MATPRLRRALDGSPAPPAAGHRRPRSPDHASPPGGPHRAIRGLWCKLWIVCARTPFQFSLFIFIEYAEQIFISQLKLKVLFCSLHLSPFCFKTRNNLILSSGAISISGFQISIFASISVPICISTTHTRLPSRLGLCSTISRRPRGCTIAPKRRTESASPRAATLVVPVSTPARHPSDAKDFVLKFGFEGQIFPAFGWLDACGLFFGKRADYAPIASVQEGCSW